MNISLTEDLDQYVKSQVDTGLFSNNSEVIRSALRIFKEQNDLRSAVIEQLNVEIAKGLAQIEEGKTVDGKTAFERIRSKYKAVAS